MVAVTYLAANQSTRPIAELTVEITSAGFRIAKQERSHGDAFAMVVATKKEDGKMVK